MTEKMSHKTGNAQCHATFFRHSAVLNLPAVLLLKVSSSSKDDGNGKDSVRKRCDWLNEEK